MAAIARSHCTVPHPALVSRKNRTGKRSNLNVAGNIPYSNGQPGALKFPKELLANRILHALQVESVLIEPFSSAAFPQRRSVALNYLTDPVADSFDCSVSRR